MFSLIFLEYVFNKKCYLMLISQNHLHRWKQLQNVKILFVIQVQFSAYQDLDHSLQRQDSTSSGPLRIPPLGELEQAQLFSCLDVVRDRMGESISEQKAVDAILAANFDVEKALDQLLKSILPLHGPKTVKETTPHSFPVTQGMYLSWLCNFHLVPLWPNSLLFMCDPFRLRFCCRSPR